MISAREGLLGVTQYRELASWLTASWTTKLWKDAPNKDELERELACAATSLATVATLTSPWLREFIDADEFDYGVYARLRDPLLVLRPQFVLLRRTYEAGGERREWAKLIEEYNKFRYVELDEKYFAPWTALEVLDDLDRRYRIWELEGMPSWQRTAERLGLGGAVQQEGDALQIRAKLPHVGRREEFLRKLLYSIHNGVEKPAAVVWDNAEPDGNVRSIAMVLCPDQKVALEISCFKTKRPLVRRHRITGGSPGNGVYTAGAQYLTYIWRKGLIHPVDAAQEVLFNCVADLAPRLPVAGVANSDSTDASGGSE